MPARRAARPSANGKAAGSVLASLAEATFLLRTSSDVGALVETVSAGARAALGAKDSQLFLIDERTGALRPWDANRGGPGEAFLPSPGGALEHALHREEPLFAGAADAARPLDQALGGKKAGAFFCFPLRARSATDGVWVATFGLARAFSTSDKLAIHLLADALALGLERSRSDRTLAERELAAQRLEARAEEGEALLGQMLSVVAHEMRTPLTCIKAYAETLIDTPGEEWESRRPFLEIINEECDRLGRLLTNALDYSRLESGQKSFHLTTLLPHELVDDVLLTMAPEGKRRSVEVQGHVPENFGSVEGDLDLLKQLGLNLVSNAIKFSPERTTVEIVVSGDEERWQLDVMDRGPGIPEEQSERVFERFYRFEQDGRHAVPGTGLGLAIARNITELHGGKIGVTARPGGGSVFTVILPRVQRAPEESRRVAAELWERRDCLRLLDEAVALVSEAMEAQIVSLMLVDPERGDLKMAAALGLDETALKRRVGFRGGVGGKALAQAAPVLVNDIETDPRFRRPNHPQYSTKSLICVPLIVGGRSIGVINVNNKRSREAFGQPDLALMSTLVDRVCSTVDRSLAFPESAESPAETMAALRASIHLRQDLAIGQRPPGAVAYALARRLGASAAEARSLSRLAGGDDAEAMEIGELNEKPSSNGRRTRVLGTARDILLARAERWDGSGHPRALSGNAIPLGARILAAVDALRDLTRGSAHRPALPAAFALEEMERLSGTRLDPRVQSALARELDEENAARPRKAA